MNCVVFEGTASPATHLQVLNTSPNMAREPPLPTYPTSYASSAIPGLHTALMSLIDFRGHRLIACSVLPISRHTLVYAAHSMHIQPLGKRARHNLVSLPHTLLLAHSYGSADAGQTVHGGFNWRSGAARGGESSATASKLMQLAGNKLNLKPHVSSAPGLVRKAVAGDTSVDLAVLHAPCDIEVHHGTDGQFYVLDTARVFPPDSCVVSRTMPAVLLRATLQPNHAARVPPPHTAEACTLMLCGCPCGKSPATQQPPLDITAPRDDGSGGSMELLALRRQSAASISSTVLLEALSAPHDMQQGLAHDRLLALHVLPSNAILVTLNWAAMPHTANIPAINAAASRLLLTALSHSCGGKWTVGPLSPQDCIVRGDAVCVRTMVGHHLALQLRPSRVASNPVPLSSDAHSWVSL